MEFGPITGIRSVSLFSPRKADKEDALRFEVDATPQTTDDEAYTPSRDAEDTKKRPREPEQASSAPEELQPTPLDDDSDSTAHDWFV